MKKTYEIKGPPIAWASHCGNGRHSFNPHFKKKRAVQWELSVQHSPNPLLDVPIRVDFFFELPPPANMKKTDILRLNNGEKIFCPKRPDLTNYRKFIEDCLTKVVIVDDNIIVCGETQKYYTVKGPKTLIMIEVA